MKPFLLLGSKNVFRQPLRSALALLGIALSVSGVVVGTSLMEGFEGTIFREALAEAGEIVVARQESFERARFNPLRYTLRDAGELTHTLAQFPGVAGAVARIDFGFLAEFEGRNATVACAGVSLESFQNFSRVPGRLIAGRFPEAGEKAVVVGRWVAEELQVEPGDRVDAIGRTVYDSFTADGFEVVGVYDMGTKLLNRGAFMPLAAAQEFLEMENAASKVVLFTDDHLQAEAIAGRLVQEVALPENVSLRPWTEDYLLGSLHQLLQAAGFLLSAIICFVAGLGILNMMMVTVLERRREIGVLMALGMSRPTILQCFLFEVGLYGFLGGILGILLGSPLALYLDRVGLDLRADDVQGLPLPIANTLHADFGPESLVMGLVTGLLLALLGALGPILKTFTMGPQDAMSR